MSMDKTYSLIGVGNKDVDERDVRKYLLKQHTETYSSWYNGTMSYSLYSKSWQKYVEPMLENVRYTSENFFKVAIDIYAEAMRPAPRGLQGLTAVQLMMRGEALCVFAAGSNVPAFPEHYEIISDGSTTIAAIFTRSLETMTDNCVFAWSDGRQELWQKPVPHDFSPATRDGYEFVEESMGGSVFRLALPDHGLGQLLSPLQDRLNHATIDEALVAEMYSRPFWYLLRYQKPVKNPYAPKSPLMTPGGPTHELLEEDTPRGDATRLFTTSSEGPFGQLTPPDLGTMVEVHRDLIQRFSQVSGLPQFYLSLSTGDVPTGVALKQLSSRFQARVGRMRDSIEPQLLAICEYMGVNLEEQSLWPAGDDLLQEAADAHGLALSTMGYPLEYIAEVVTPGVDLASYGSPDE